MQFPIVPRQPLFIRPCYPLLWEEVQFWFRRTWFSVKGPLPYVSVRVTGTPGTGKSSFLIYAVQQVGCDL